MLKWMMNLAVYAVTLVAALLSVPYLIWSHGIVTIDHLALSLAAAPVVFWGVWYAHGVLFDHGLVVAKYVYKLCVSKLAQQPTIPLLFEKAENSG